LLLAGTRTQKRESHPVAERSLEAIVGGRRVPEPDMAEGRCVNQVDRHKKEKQLFARTEKKKRVDMQTHVIVMRRNAKTSRKDRSEEGKGKARS